MRECSHYSCQTTEDGHPVGIWHRFWVVIWGFWGVETSVPLFPTICIGEHRERCHLQVNIDRVSHPSFTLSTSWLPIPKPMTIRNQPMAVRTMKTGAICRWTTSRHAGLYSWDLLLPFAQYQKTLSPLQLFWAAQLLSNVTLRETRDSFYSQTAHARKYYTHELEQSSGYCTINFQW